LFTSLPDPIAGGACCPLSKKYKVQGAFGLVFRPFVPHSAASSNGLHFPQCIGVLIKTLVVPIFGAKECIRAQDFVLKIYKNFRGSRPPDPRSGRGDICSYPPLCPPARCWCPFASSGLATALGVHELKIDMRDYVRDFTPYAKYRKIWLGGLFPAVW